ncbi:MAG: histidine phosphatase family protein [Anaerolineae bacterium]|nr:histidine phosphatase family protein [Anaerolineae bacterium]
MQFYFVRHGQSMGNMTNDYSTSAHDHLSPNGWQQAEQLAERLGGIHFDAIYVSTATRTRQTITPFLQRYSIRAKLWPALQEACWHRDRTAPVPVRTAPPVQFVIPTETSAHFDVLDGYQDLPPVNETYQEGRVRVIDVYKSLLRWHGGRPDTILVIGHEYAGGRLVELLLGLEPDGRIQHSNTGLTYLIEQDDHTFHLKFANRI